MELESLTAREILRLLAGRELTAKNCVSYFLDRIESLDERYNAFLTIDHSRALQQAEQVDQRRNHGEPLGIAAGLPIAIKDGICTNGIRTTAGSKILKDFIPPYDATVIKRLKHEDAIVIGKTNMDEFAMGSANENPHFGNTHNPWQIDRVPGGSSGGSAAAVSAGLAPWALGSDTGGSVRQPAAFCGVTGLKPTYGRVSRNGLIAYASSLDQIGTLTKNAADAALLLDIISGHDPLDATSSTTQSTAIAGELDLNSSGLRIGFCPEHLDRIDPEISAAIVESKRVFGEQGIQFEEIDLPHLKYAIAAYYVIAPCEASSNLSRYDGVRFTSRVTGESLEQMYTKTRADGFGEEVKRRILLGTFALSSGYYDAYYLNASRIRRMIKQDFDKAFDKVDLILFPTTPTPAFEIGAHRNDPTAMYLSDAFTVSANLAGIPAISIPCGMTQSHLPIGMQLLGRAFDEQTLLQVAHLFQSMTDWHQLTPTIS